MAENKGRNGRDQEAPQNGRERAPNEAHRSEPIVRIAPGPTGVSIWSAALFGDASVSPIREFVERAFSVEEVASVEIRRADFFGRVRYGATPDAPNIWRRLSLALRPSDAGRSFTEPAGGGREKLAASNLFLDGPPDDPLRIARIGSTLSTWRVRAANDHKIRLAHPILRGRADMIYRLEEELAAILGVESFRSSALSASVGIRFDPHVLTVERLVGELEKSWPRLLEGLDGPPSSKRFFAAGGLLGLAYTGQYLVPALRPVAVLGVALYGLPNVVNGARQLQRLQIGLPALYSAGLAFMLLSGMPFFSTVMAVLMQFWPRLAYGTARRSQRRLFAMHRRRAASARLAQPDGVEAEIDVDMLKAGDLIALRTGDVIPVDGIVTEGLAAVVEETLSGVAGAIDKLPGDAVYRGSFIRDGRLVARVERVGDNTVAGSIAARLPHARLNRLPSSGEAERIANRNAKPALALAALSLLATRRMRPSQALIRPDYATAPRLSAQLAALHDLAEGLQRGIFFRDIGALDRLSATDIYVFDDGSGLERKQIEVAEVISAGSASADAILGYATAAFPVSQNERAYALLALSLERNAAIPAIRQRARHAGVIRYRDADDNVLEVATPAYAAASGLPIPPALAKAAGASIGAADPRRRRAEGGNPDEPLLRPLLILKNGEALGAVTFRRHGKAEGTEVVAALKARNRRARFVYVSSQPQAAARAIAREAGIAAVYGDLDGAGKARIINRLGRRTMWIGDGASPLAGPCIEASTVSISTAGFASAAADAADIVLLAPGLQNLAPLRRIGRSHRARLEADYRALYIANLAGAAGGLLTGFGSLEAGLTSNAGTAYIYARNWKRLHDLIARVETRHAALFSPAAEERDDVADRLAADDNDAEHFVDYKELDPSGHVEADQEGV
ncbi:E1-E2 ATPase-associated domain protein [Methylocella silvestris BL2]|uniref:E1-E2 ATPase-associated domain protein n=1 Tax=Methylocella silvestris (strain DSM 15510 / CIP 108128 / LMG 27833 / NCIMB 13906 / BL2) TaxID=395965 RepID=B8ETB9_METSB|nr:HAD family hydrolase [Methylocella silvestris]ACK51761.1 E1-E2 ATPase-associated domain protein [Methylocella silvestris BL2]